MIFSLNFFWPDKHRKLLHSMFDEIVQEHKALQQQKKQQLKVLESKIVD